MEKKKDTRRKRSGRVSNLRTIYNDLKRLSKKAIQNVDDSVQGKNVDKEVLSSSKWVVDRLNTYSKAVIYEEEYLNGKLKSPLPADEDRDQSDPKEDGKVIRFSLERVTG